MAQADFDFASNGTGSLTSGDGYGSARLHSALTNELTGEGSYCREYSIVDTNNVAQVATIKSSVNSGEFVEIPATKAVSVRAWLRHDDVSVGSFGIGIGCKLHSGAPPTGLSAPRGYSVMIGDTAQTGASSNLRVLIDNSGTTDITNTGYTVTDDTWFKIRMDVIPVGTSQDIIEIYTGTGATGSETWTLRNTQNVLNSDAWYIPWAQSTHGRVGWWTVSDTATHDLHIDRFQVFLEDV
jgi:hypothetical protein